MTDAAPAPNHLKDTLEEMRASVAARKGLAGAIEKAMLGLLELLLALLADFRAGRLAPVAPSEEIPAPGPSPAYAGEGDEAARPTSPARHRGLLERAWGFAWRTDGAGRVNCGVNAGDEDAADGCSGSAKLDRAAAGQAGGADNAVAHPSPSRIGSHLCPQKREPVADPSSVRFAAQPLKGRGMPSGQNRFARLCVSLRPQRFEIDNRTNPAAVAAVAGDARHWPGFPALQMRTNSKNGVLDEGDSDDSIVPG